MIDPVVDRRAFLTLAGAGTLGLLTACNGAAQRPPDDQPPVTRADALEGDLAVAALLASLENLLVGAYQDGIERRERLGPYSPAVDALIETAQRQHQEHAVAWNSILSGAGRPGVTGVNLNVKGATVDPALFRARDDIGLLNAIHEVNTIVATTYLAAMGSLQNNAALKVAASIHPVECQHLGVLTFLLGRNLPTDSFTHVEGARPTTDSIG